MYKEHTSFTSIDDNNKLWRYMDFSKFIDILENNSLFFTRADKFEDKFEGSYPKGNKIEWEKRQRGKYDDNFKEFINWQSLVIKKLRKYTCISCWHANEFESDAMWKLYSQSNEAIAIQSSFGRLKKSFDDESKNVYIGKVNYIDYDKECINESCLYNFVLNKRKSFIHEQEVRAVVGLADFTQIKRPNCDLKETPPDFGVNINVNLEELVEKIYISPLAPKWFADLVKKVIKRYGYDFEVNYSKLKENEEFWEF